jgi:hypothetical protein
MKAARIASNRRRAPARLQYIRSRTTKTSKIMTRAISTRSIRLKRTLFEGLVSRKKSLVKKDIIVYIPPLIMLRLSV